MNASISLGLQLGDREDDFIANHSTKGCYAIEGKAFFGNHGSKVEHRKSILKPLFRPNGYDCGNIQINLSKNRIFLKRITLNMSYQIKASRFVYRF